MRNAVCNVVCGSAYYYYFKYIENCSNIYNSSVIKIQIQVNGIVINFIFLKLFFKYTNNKIRIIWYLKIYVKVNKVIKHVK